MIEFLQTLSSVLTIAYVTGRPERTRQTTLAWFRKHCVPWKDGGILAMRTDVDHREDHIVKLELFMKWFCPENVCAIIEDRDQVVDMWRGYGFLCLQPKRGNY